MYFQWLEKKGCIKRNTRTGDVCIGREVVWKLRNRRPNSFQHLQLSNGPYSDSLNKMGMATWYIACEPMYVWAILS